MDQLAPCVLMKKAFNARAAAQRIALFAYFDPQNESNEASHELISSADLAHETTTDHATTTSNSHTAAGHERSQASSEQERRRAKKRVSYDSNTRHLVPNYGSPPKDAVSLIWPTSTDDYDRAADWPGPQPRQETLTAMAGPHKVRGGIQPRNTLHSSTRQAPSPGRGHNSSGTSNRAESRTGSKKSLRTLQTVSSRGSNVGIKRAPMFEEDLDQHPGYVTKRRKTSEGVRQEIDLTGNDNGDLPFDEPVFGETIGRASQKPISVESRRSRNTKQEASLNDKANIDDYFESTSFHKSERNWGPDEDDKVRAKIQKDNSVGSQHGVVRISSGVSQRPPVNSSINGDQHRFRSQQPIQQPPINLDEGIDEAGEEHPKKFNKSEQGSDSDICKVNAILKSAASNQGPMQRTGNANIHKRHEIRGQASRLGSSLRTVPDESSTLRRQFKRDASTPDRAPRKKLRQSMQDSDLDVDELAGSTTIRKPRHSSPGRHSNASVPSTLSRTNTRPTRRHSPSDITPTNFKSAPARQTPAKSISRSNNPFDLAESDERIPIRSICARAYVSCQKGLQLVWHGQNRIFHIECGGHIVHSLLNGQPLTIGHSDVSSSWTQSGRLLAAHLKGSASQDNSGQILLTFRSSDDMSVCHDFLMYACRDKMKTKSVSSDRMQGLLHNTTKQLEDLHKKYQDKARTNTSELTSASRLVSQQYDDRSGQAHDDERIIDEDEDNSSQPHDKARNRMGASDSLAKAIIQEGYQQPRGQETVSKFFPQPASRRSTRQTKPIKPKSPSPPPVEKWTDSHKLDPWPRSVVFPLGGVRPATVDFSDLGKLDEGEFLNDNIVNFELRRTEEMMEPGHRARVHFFNTYFFSALSSKNGRKSFNYDAVARWTKKIDIFSIPYTIVPVNVDLHWFVVIICNMQNLRRNPPDLGIEEDVASSDHYEAAVVREDEDTYNEGLPAQSSSPDHDARAADSSSDVFQFGDDGTVLPSSADSPKVSAMKISGPGSVNGKKPKKKSLHKYDPSGPILITMDSFGLPRATEIKYLKQYLCAEADSKRGMKIDAGELQGMNAKGLPEQPDFHNCGVYLIGYITEFAKDPDRFVRRVLQREVDEEKDFADFDPSAKRAEIRNRLLKLQGEQEARHRANKKARQAARKGQPVPAAATTTMVAMAERDNHEEMGDFADQSNTTSEARLDAPSTNSVPAVNLEISPLRRGSNDDGEMLDVSESRDAVQQPESISIRNQADDKSGPDLLAALEPALEVDQADDLKTNAENASPAQRDNLIQAVEFTEPAVIEVDNVEDEHKEVVILDSQEAAPMPTANEAKHIYFAE